MQIRPEYEVILRCARRDLSQLDRDRILELSRANLDWNELLNVALLHGLGPLLHRNLEATLGESLQQQPSALLRENATRAAAKSVYLSRTMLSIVDALEHAGIPSIPFKGPTLAITAYRDLSLRSFTDLDVLVPERDVIRAHDILASQGFGSSSRLSPAQHRAFIQSGYTYELRRGSDGVQLELHWRFAPGSFGFHLEWDELWERHQQVEIAGRQVPSLAPEDLLLVLCMHGAKHAWAALEGIVALAELLRRHPTLDWDSVRDRAGRARAARMLHLGLLLADDLLDAPLPAVVVERMRADRTAKLLATRVKANLFGSGTGPSEQAETFRMLAFQLRSKDNLMDQARFCFHTLTTITERDWKAADLANPRSPLYWAIRPFRLATKYGHRLMSRSRWSP